ncbi:unnamed protein product [Hymenolepis diminuta]|uniref:Uncharacterized protein n=1 Tax=Hymenolepis diminuta TaxID=6216 RepID=A0A564Z9E2_HYMDI|nr:unnamed protein product [Hymenolepis diminuta]
MDKPLLMSVNVTLSLVEFSIVKPLPLNGQWNSPPISMYLNSFANSIPLHHFTHDKSPTSDFQQPIPAARFAPSAVAPTSFRRLFSNVLLSAYFALSFDCVVLYLVNYLIQLTVLPIQRFFKN